MEKTQNMPFLCLLKKAHWGNIALKLKFDVENVNVKTEFLKNFYLLIGNSQCLLLTYQ